ncbi:hypothetical protein [Bacillus swezeyi]|uniref:Uncharacterized protein n=1 Tax=Bacillus swezeyi TaxID=1925020 RepID=A0A5M8RIV1_9BACI|nr:hypothetical protein [Bacillus swezeyi]KAA6446993.1 hypothetical protein DX927_23410 [Bacillus swezeyi]KAA6471561.1 hypothetical protein DX928_23650 [Bacillus swezeyi]
MDKNPSSVEGLIFQTHIQRLQELMAKFVEETITKEEWKELWKLNEQCIEMMASTLEDTNKLSMKESLIPKDESQTLIKLLHESVQKVKNSNKRMEDFFD